MFPVRLPFKGRLVGDIFHIKKNYETRTQNLSVFISL